jgi:hypothetical protein
MKQEARKDGPMFCAPTFPSRGVRSTDGEFIGHGLLALRAGSPKTRMARILDCTALVRVVSEHMHYVKLIQTRRYA